MDSASTLTWSFVNDDRAATAIEYALIAAAISLAIAPMLPLVAGALQATFNQLADAL